LGSVSPGAPTIALQVDIASHNALCPCFYAPVYRIGFAIMLLVQVGRCKVMRQLSRLWGPVQH